MKNSNVFPNSASAFNCQQIVGGITLQQYAAIALKVPESGVDWLDAMIEKSLQNDRNTAITTTEPVPDKEVWVTWNGHPDKNNSNPPHGLTGPFEYKLQASCSGSVMTPDSLDWSIHDSDYDIVAYRPLPS